MVNKVLLCAFCYMVLSLMQPNNAIFPDRSELIALERQSRSTRLSAFADAAIVAQLLAIRDNHPQWRNRCRENGVIAAHAYAAQLKNFSTPHEIIEL